MHWRKKTIFIYIYIYIRLCKTHFWNCQVPFWCLQIYIVWHNFVRQQMQAKNQKVAPHLFSTACAHQNECDGDHWSSKNCEFTQIRQPIYGPCGKCWCMPKLTKNMCGLKKIVGKWHPQDYPLVLEMLLVVSYSLSCSCCVLVILPPFLTSKCSFHG